MMRASREKLRGPSAVTVRQMLVSDVPAAISILRESPEASIWPEESLLEWASKGDAWVAELKDCIAGVLIGRVAADEFEILNLAVGKSYRRRGAATRLVVAALEWSQAAGADQTYLEVRASNIAGIAFYTHIGFHVCGRRHHYYRNPEDDAVLLVLRNTERNP